MKRTLSSVVAALILACSAIFASPVSAVAEYPIATAARAALGGSASGSLSTAERVPTVGTVDQTDAATPAGVPLEPLGVLAAEIASTVRVDPEALLAAWRTTSPQRLRVMLTALAQVGTAYRYGGNTPAGFDCSGLTSYSWASVGVRLPRTSTLQIEQVLPRELSQLRAGDLLWRPGHIGMSLGVPDIMVNATQTGRPVEVKRWGRVVRVGSPIAD